MLRRIFIKLRIHYQIWHCNHQLLIDYYNALTPLLELPIKQVRLFALDLEMTGLNPRHDEIVSIGLIPIIDGKIVLNRGQHKLIKISGSVGQSAVIHGVTDHALNQAIALDEAINWLLKETLGGILIAHHASLDLSFIQRALYQQTKQNKRLFAIDTMYIEQRRLTHKQQIIKQGDLRLNNCRQRYNLPHYDAHNALVDALSCAELLLAQMSKMGDIEKIKVSELIT